MDPNKNIGENNKSIIPPKMRKGIAASFAIIGVVSSVKLILLGNPVALLGLASVSFVFAFIVMFYEILEYVDWNGKKLQFREVKEAKNEVIFMKNEIKEIRDQVHIEAEVIKGWKTLERERKERESQQNSGENE